MSVCYKEFQKRLEIEEYPYEYTEGMQYEDLSLFQRTLLFHFICEIQVENPDFKTKIESLYVDNSQWRVQPVGFDANGCIYWLFDDCRLYREATWKKEHQREIDMSNRKPSSAPTKSHEVAEPVAKKIKIEEEESAGEPYHQYMISPPLNYMVTKPDENPLKIRIKPLQTHPEMEYWTLVPLD